jgi:hypothetical protein
MVVINCSFLIVQYTIRFFDDIELENCHFFEVETF